MQSFVSPGGRWSRPATSLGPSLLVLVLAYLAALAYGTLYPLTGWRYPGAGATAALFSGWPRYWTWLDVLANIALYMPLGMLVTFWLRARWRMWPTVLGITLLAAALSAGLELAQSFLPNRVTSSLDWFTNTLGAGLGALIIRLTQPSQTLVRTGWHRPEVRADLDFGLLILLGTWLVSQCAPQTVMFEMGVLPAAWWTKPTGLPDDLLVIIEAGIVACGVCSAGLLLRAIVRPSDHLPFMICLLVAVAACLNIGAAVILHGAPIWLPAGAQAGLVIGALALGLVVPARAANRRLALLIFLVAGMVLSNIYPLNSYRADLFTTLRQPGLRNLIGLLSALLVVWPVAAWVMILRYRGTDTSRLHSHTP